MDQSNNWVRNAVQDLKVLAGDIRKEVTEKMNSAISKKYNII